MVFQAGRTIRIGGTCVKNIELRLEFLDRCMKLKTTDTTFVFEIPPMDYQTEGFDIEVSARKQSVILEDCVIGEVFLFAGGSNMDMSLKESYEKRPEPDRRIRLYKAPRLPYADAHLEFPKFYSNQAKWVKATGSALLDQGALAFHFAEEIAYEQEVPIGIVQVAFPDAAILSLVGLNELVASSRFGKYLEAYKKEVTKHPGTNAYAEIYAKETLRMMEHLGLRDQYVQDGMALDRAEHMAWEECPYKLPMGTKHPARPSGLFDTLIKPLQALSFKAVVFYQGEADLEMADAYEEAQKTLIANWRAWFADPSLPFVIVQLAGIEHPPVNNLALPRLREAQRRAAESMDSVHLATAVDLGEIGTALPREKAVLARRVANVVLEKVYRKGKNQSAPAYYSHQASANQLVIQTQYNHLNLVSRSRNQMGFVGLTEDGTLKPLRKVKLTANQIVIEGFEEFREIRYCYENAPVCDIYTANDLPLLPFAIEIEIEA
jgi:sialate O-acetylesterase